MRHYRGRRQSIWVVPGTRGIPEAAADAEVLAFNLA